MNESKTNKLSDVEDIGVFLSLIGEYYYAESRTTFLHVANKVARDLNKMSNEAKLEILQSSIEMRRAFSGNDVLVIDGIEEKYEFPKNLNLSQQEDLSYSQQFDQNGFVSCPECSETISKEDDSEKLNYCDTCGYRFSSGRCY